MSATQLLLGALLLGVAKAQLFDPSIALQPPPLHQGAFAAFSAAPQQQAFLMAAPLPMLRQQQVQQPNQVLAHHAVVRASEDEDRLPEDLHRSNKFYSDPRIADGLAKSSWFIPGEEQVVDREAEKIPREQVFKLLKNAGLARRR